MFVTIHEDVCKILSFVNFWQANKNVRKMYEVSEKVKSFTNILVDFTFYKYFVNSQ